MSAIEILFAAIIAFVLLLILGIGLRKYNYNKKWNWIEELNKRVDITRENAYIDENGYLRWAEDGNLCHRDVAFVHIYKGNEKRIDLETGEITVKFAEPFDKYDVHHVDENKLNADYDNLAILTREEHQVEHGRIIHENGEKYIRLCHVSKVYRETRKAILVARRWVPKSTTIVVDGYVHVAAWMYRIKFGNRFDKREPLPSRTPRLATDAIETRACGRRSCTGCEFYNEFDKVCQKP